MSPDRAKHSAPAAGQVRADVLRRALDLWRGPVLDGLAAGPGMQRACRALENLRLGLDPGPELSRLHTTLLRRDRSLAAGPVPA